MAHELKHNIKQLSEQLLYSIRYNEQRTTRSCFLNRFRYVLSPWQQSLLYAFGLHLSLDVQLAASLVCLSHSGVAPNPGSMSQIPPIPPPPPPVGRQRHLRRRRRHHHRQRVTSAITTANVSPPTSPPPTCHLRHHHHHRHLRHHRRHHTATVHHHRHHRQRPQPPSRPSDPAATSITATGLVIVYARK